MLATRRIVRSPVPAARWASTTASKDKYKVLVIGAGAGGLTVANQIYDRFKKAGKALNKGDIAIVAAAEFHDYQPGWTLVGSGLKNKKDLRKPVTSLIGSHLAHIKEDISTFTPQASTVTTTSGRTIGYESLVVATGLQINWNQIPGLKDGLSDTSSGISSIYSYETADKVWRDVDALGGGRAIFTQPAGVIKCPGAPQKIMWMAHDRYRRTGRGDIKVDFYNGMPTMFSVKKYSDALNDMRIERGIGGYFQHNLSSIDVGNRKATFTKADGSKVTEDYDLLHVAPPQGPLDVIKASPIADAAGWVDLNINTLQHMKYPNVWAVGDCTNLPTSRTAAAITAQAPVLTENIYSFVTTGKLSPAMYDGYTSCPLFTGYGELMLAEFKYGFEPKESFSAYFNQAKPNRPFYHLGKDIFPRAYYNFMLSGNWFGPKGLVRPKFAPAQETIEGMVAAK